MVKLPGLAKSPVVVNVAPPVRVKLPMLSARELISGIELVPLNSIEPSFSVRLPPGRLRVPPPETIQVPPVNVEAEICDTVDVSEN